MLGLFVPPASPAPCSLSFVPPPFFSAPHSPILNVERACGGLQCETVAPLAESVSSVTGACFRLTFSSHSCIQAYQNAAPYWEPVRKIAAVLSF